MKSVEYCPRSFSLQYPHSGSSRRHSSPMVGYPKRLMEESPVNSLSKLHVSRSEASTATHSGLDDPRNRY